MTAALILRMAVWQLDLPDGQSAMRLLQRLSEENPLLIAGIAHAYLHAPRRGPIPDMRDRALVLGARPEADGQEDYGLQLHLAMDRTFIWVADQVPSNYCFAPHQKHHNNTALPLHSRLYLPL